MFIFLKFGFWPLHTLLTICTAFLTAPVETFGYIVDFIGVYDPRKSL